MCVCTHVCIYGSKYCVCVCRRTCCGIRVWRSENNLLECSFLLYHVGLEDWTQAVRLRGKCSYPRSHLTSLHLQFNFAPWARAALGSSDPTGEVLCGTQDLTQARLEVTCWARAHTSGSASPDLGESCKSLAWPWGRWPFSTLTSKLNHPHGCWLLHQWRKCVCAFVT